MSFDDSDSDYLASIDSSLGRIAESFGRIADSLEGIESTLKLRNFSVNATVWQGEE